MVGRRSAVGCDLAALAAQPGLLGRRGAVGGDLAAMLAAQPGRRVGQPALDDLLELVGSDRLRQIVVHAHLDAALAVAGQRMCRQGDDWYAIAVLVPADPACC